MRERELCFLTVQALLTGYRDGSLSPVRVIDAILQRIEHIDTAINAYALVDAEQARKQAQESAWHWKNGTPRGRLEGVPVAIKDVLAVTGWPTRHGSPACADAPLASHDAVAVDRLREHGAIFLGKTRTWEFAWHGRVDRPSAEVVRNPWQLEYSCAGSSSGSAAAVASGLCALALGTDSGGSVRGPASFCSVVGIKPTHARVPVYPPSPMMDMEHIGVLARTARDAAIGLSVIAGYHHRDPDSWPFAAVDLSEDIETGVEGLRIGVSRDLGFTIPHADIVAVYEQTLERASAIGLEMVALDVNLADSLETTTTIYTPMAMASLDEVDLGKDALADPVVRQLSKESETLSSKDYFRAQQKRLSVCRIFTEAFEQLDLILIPTMEALPNRLDEPSPDMLLNRVFDMTGQPSVSVPAGFSSHGLPIGMQIVAPKGRDALALRAAHAFQCQYPMGGPPDPPLLTDPSST